MYKGPLCIRVRFIYVLYLGALFMYKGAILPSYPPGASPGGKKVDEILSSLMKFEAYFHVLQ